MMANTEMISGVQKSKTYVSTIGSIEKLKKAKHNPPTVKIDRNKTIVMFLGLSDCGFSEVILANEKGT